MTLIPDKNFNKLFTTELNLDGWHYLTESLDTVHKLDLFSRYTLSNEFDSVTLCNNIKYTFENLKKTLNHEEHGNAVKNLEAMQSKFSNLRKSHRKSACQETIQEIINNLKEKNSGSKKKYFAPKEYYYDTPLQKRSIQPTTPQSCASYIKAAPASWRRPVETTAKSNPAPVKVESSPIPHTSKKKHREKMKPVNATETFALEAKKHRRHLRHVTTTGLQA